MKAGRHTKNRMREYDLRIEDLLEIIASPVTVDADPDGRPRYSGRVKGQIYRVVVAADDPEFIVRTRRSTT